MHTDTLNTRGCALAVDYHTSLCFHGHPKRTWTWTSAMSAQPQRSDRTPHVGCTKKKNMKKWAAPSLCTNILSTTVLYIPCNTCCTFPRVFIWGNYGSRGWYDSLCAVYIIYSTKALTRVAHWAAVKSGWLWIVVPASASIITPNEHTRECTASVVNGCFYRWQVGGVDDVSASFHIIAHDS